MKKIVKKIWLVVKCCILAYFTLSLFFVILYKYVPVYYTPMMLRPKTQHQWKPLEQISPQMIKAVLASEDYLFLIHNGFDAGNENVNMNRGARILYHESKTISQQTACAVFLFAGDSYWNKLMESYYTVLVELIWGKGRIMEIYLNSIEMGDGLFGAEATAQAYYAVSAEDLTAFEAAGIAACLINPKKLNPCDPDTYILRRQAKIRTIMDEMMEIQWK
ncbi:MAG: transglycosylase domain-containing protein [Candidatus Symbiothrix sp.]|jgi:monofunctional biosynthetic peptidoglycan transglycosylase|nr:transglycosylase domain-containing protein [Candidatus Symbiothrix sp.]